MVCRPPAFTATSGRSTVIDIDTSDAFRQNTLVTPSPSALGSFSLDGDLLTYTANAGIDTSRDVLTVRSCTDEEAVDCFEREIAVLIGRVGARRDTTIDVRGGEVVTVPVARPPAELLCGSVNERGDYEYAAFRRARFSEYVPGDLIRYRSSRGSGEDEFLVLLCNGFGTCDTTDLRFRVSAPRIAELPFFDDFSYDGPRPDSTRWIEDDVFVNDAYGRRAPSYGVATLDGVDGGGRRYGEGLINVDQLTTAEMDLSAVTGDPVWVKYYLQVGGRGQAPEETDRVITQFRHADGRWIDQVSFAGSPLSTPDSNFVYQALPVLGDSFLHADFQVRFLMRANGGGDFDNFNLDYVRVEQAPDESPFARDIALAARPPSPLTPYTRVPFTQFQGRGSELLRTQLPVEVWNHFPEVNNVSNTAVVAEDANGIELVDAGLLTGAQFNLPPGFSRFVNPIPEAPLAGYRSAVNGVDEAGAAGLALRYELDIDQDQQRLEGFLRNDTASTLAVIENEFAYDDGTAEAGIFNGSFGERIVVRYETAVDDSLRGLRYAFPPLNEEDVRGQLINLQVYVGPLSTARPAPAPETEGDTPREYEDAFVRPYLVSDARDTVQGFTTYDLVDASGVPKPLFIPAGEFYIGWQQADQSNQPVQVGLDLNNDNAGQIFTEFGQGWQPLTDFFPNLRASLMVRPVFGDEAPGNSSATENTALRKFRAYPNPTSGTFRLETDARDVTAVAYRVTDITGRRVARGAYAEELSLDAPAGLYVVEVLDDRGAVVGRVRLVVRR